MFCRITNCLVNTIDINAQLAPYKKVYESYWISPVMNRQIATNPKHKPAEFDLYQLPIHEQLDLLGIPQKSFYSFYDSLCKNERIPDSDDICPKDHHQIFLFLRTYHVFRGTTVNTTMLSQFDNLLNTQYARTSVKESGLEKKL